VLLYKLLTGKHPYGPGVLSPADLQKAICEKTPLRPSAVVLSDEGATIPQATQKLQVQQVEPETYLKARRRLRKKLAGDLDMIVLMALRKEAKRRYASVEQFSEDLRRYLEGRPVIARSDTFGYRAAKFVRRNAPAVVAACLAGVALLAGAVVANQHAIDADRKRVAAEQRLKSFETASLNQLQALTEAHLRLAELQQADPDAALAGYRTALTTARAFVQQHPEVPDAHKILERVAVEIGDRHPEEAVDRYSEAKAQLETIGERGSAEYLKVLLRLGKAQFLTGDRFAAPASFTTAIQVAETQSAASPDPETRRNLAIANLRMGEVLSRNGENDAAAVKLRKAFELFQDLAGTSVATPDDNPAGYQHALMQIANARPDLKQDIQAELQLFGRWDPTTFA